jgi:ketosteroid isomerase-like protein
MSSDTRSEILGLGARWAEAEQRADTAALDDLAVENFRLVGPFGFVLDKAQWLGRYLGGGLATSSLVWDDVEVRDFGDVAIAIGRQTQRATYQGRPADGQYRGTQVFVRGEGGWRLASIQLSPLSGPG